VSLAYLGPLSLFVLTPFVIRTDAQFRVVETAGKKGIVLFVIQIAIFLAVSSILSNQWWEINLGIIDSSTLGILLCAALSCIFSIAELFGKSICFPEPMESWAINLKI
jgi:hypothetical protein